MTKCVAVAKSQQSMSEVDFKNFETNQANTPGTLITLIRRRCVLIFFLIDNISITLCDQIQVINLKLLIKSNSTFAVNCTNWICLVASAEMN